MRLELDTVRFEDNADFRPDFSPRRMLELGVYGGFAFREGGYHPEYPPEWFTNARISQYPINGLNYFGVSGRNLRDDTEVQALTDVDPLGWFQWYCRYHEGRRVPEIDVLQIARWASARVRLHGHLMASSLRTSDNLRRRQALLEWACDPYPETRHADPQ